MITAIFNPDSAMANAYGLWQWDYGQVLRIQGLHLPSMVEIHFSLQETGGTSVMRVGVTKDGVTDVIIPDSMLENDGATRNYEMFAFVYLTDVTSGQTEYKIKLQVKSRPKPEVPGGGEKPDIFHEAVQKVKESADKAAESEKQAEGWAHGREDLPERAQDNAKYYSDQAAADAKKTGADRKEVERLVESVSGIDEQVAKVENLTKQAQTSATNAALSEQAAKTAETNAQTAQAGAETAEGNAELAEQGAKASEQAVEKAKQLVIQMGQEVLNNKNHVDQTAHEFTLTAQQAVADVNNAGQTQTERVQAAGNTAVESVKTAQDTATKAVEAAKVEAVQAVRTEGTTQTGTVTAEGIKQVQAVQAAAQEIVADREQIQKNKSDILDLTNSKADGIVEKAAGKTVVLKDASDLPVKSLQGTGKITITGKNILNEQYNVFVPFPAKAGTVFTLLTNGHPSEGGNIRFDAEDDSTIWFAIEKGQTKVTRSIQKNVRGFYNLLGKAEGLKYCFSAGENEKYEEYVEQVVTTPIDSERLKTIHTNYPCTVLTSENEITVEYVADTEKYIEKRIKEENQTLQKQILEIQNALISQKISGGGIKVTDSARLPIKGFKVFGKSIQDGVPTMDNPVPITSVGDKGSIDVSVHGGNLFNISLYTDEERNGITAKKTEDDGYHIWGSTGEELFVGRGVKMQLSKGYYYISDKNHAINSKYRLLIRLTNSKTGAIRYMEHGQFEVNENDEAFSYFQVEPNQTVDVTLYPMINAGKEKLPYEPYKPVQSLALQTLNGLLGIPVKSGGNYIDETGQQWVCDEIDLEHGKYVQRILKTKPKQPIVFETRDRNGRCSSFGQKLFDIKFKSGSFPALSTIAKYSDWANGADGTFALTQLNGFYYKDSTKTLEEVNEIFTKLGTDFEVCGMLGTPIEHDLPSETIEIYRALHTNYPTTVITNDGGCNMELTYTVDTKKYVDTQIADISRAVLAQKGF